MFIMLAMRFEIDEGVVWRYDGMNFSLTWDDNNMDESVDK